LSHDPTHWRSEILHYPQLTLTLAGHTHAAQMGVDVGKWRFSPSQWVYDEWDGLYREHGQFLFVNRGLGYVGIPFRLGMPPEITVITLKTFAE
ncbi:MAG: metallophosphoesterase, partial [Paludibacteraceae bacterium]|nr:metallophosphoesterase [Paludibacteraceae bacterium]